MGQPCGRFGTPSEGRRNPQISPRHPCSGHRHLLFLNEPDRAPATGSDALEFQMHERLTVEHECGRISSRKARGKEKGIKEMKLVVGLDNAEIGRIENG